jgi:phosphatidylglycerophosphate synthase
VYLTTPSPTLPADRQQTAAALFQALVLGALGPATGFGPAGWLAGIAAAAGLQLLLAGAVRRAGRMALGPADLVTMTRAILAVGTTALVADGLVTGRFAVVPFVVVAGVALALDAVDGQVARRTGTCSELGARFDMETDAFLILVLSVQVATVFGPWVLAIGLLRYAFVAAGWLAPWLTGALSPRYSAKVVAAAQGIVLVIAAAFTGVWVAALVALALTALVWSFAHDVRRLWVARRDPSEGDGSAVGGALSSLSQ